MTIRPRLPVSVSLQLENRWSLRGKEEGENIAEAVSPGVFIMQSALYALVEEGLTGLPAALDEDAKEQIGIAEMVSAFCGADIEPDRQVWGDQGPPGQPENAAPVPPDRGRDNRNLPDLITMLEGKEEGDQAAQRRSTECGVIGRRERTELPIDEGLEIVQQELPVERPAAAAELRVCHRCVLRHAIDASVSDADEDHWFHAGDLGQAISGGVGTPGVTGEVGCSAVKEVLAVVQVKDGKAALRLRKVGGGKIDRDAAICRNRCASQGTELVARVRREFRVQHGGRGQAGRSDWYEGGSARF